MAFSKGWKFITALSSASVCAYICVSLFLCAWNLKFTSLLCLHSIAHTFSLSRSGFAFKMVPTLFGSMLVQTCFLSLFQLTDFSLTQASPSNGALDLTTYIYWKYSVCWGTLNILVCMCWAHLGEGLSLDIRATAHYSSTPEIQQQCQARPCLQLHYSGAAHCALDWLLLPNPLCTSPRIVNGQ